MRKEWFNPYNGRRYQVEVFEDLLGDWILLRRWSDFCRAGNQKVVVLASYHDALNQVKSIEGKRRLRGYRPVMI
jgi:hypothetical protein